MLNRHYFRSEQGLIVLAFFVTYLANWWAVRSIPPFLLAGIRFTVAGVLMLGASAMMGKAGFTLRQFRNALWAGLFLFVVGNGFAVWALLYIDSGMSALIISFQPLIVVGFQWVMLRKIPGWDTLLGIGVAILGMAWVITTLSPICLIEGSLWLIFCTLYFVFMYNHSVKFKSSIDRGIEEL